MKLALFGTAPGRDDSAGPFTGRAGQQLWADMSRYVGLEREDFYVSNIVKHELPKNRDPKPHEVAAAMPEVLDELEEVNPRFIVTAGAYATKALLGDVGMNNVHGIPHEVCIAGRDYTVLPIFSPGAGLTNKGFLSAFAYDLKALRKLLDGALEPWKPSELPARTSWLLGHPAAVFGPSGCLVAVDTEGWTEKPWGLSFSADGEAGWVIKTTDRLAVNWFAKWLKGKTVAMHNGLHDIPVLRAMGVEIGSYHDTQVLAYHDMLKTGSGVLESEAQNLGTLAYREVQLCLGELSDLRGVDLDNYLIPYTDEVMHYAGMDPIATWRVFKSYERRGLLNYQPYQIDMGQVPLVESMMTNGIPFDQSGALDYYVEVVTKLETVTERLVTKAGRLGIRDFNPGSHPQVRELLTKKVGIRPRKRTKGGLASTSEKALADYKSEPVVAMIQEYRELKKLQGTYLEPLLRALQ